MVVPWVPRAGSVMYGSNMLIEQWFRRKENEEMNSASDATRLHQKNPHRIIKETNTTSHGKENRASTIWPWFNTA
jgi:hypothetical protein